NELHKTDLAAYVLNRVKPMYVTSGRGVLHGEMSFEKNIQESADIFSLIAEGMRVIKSRRDDLPQNLSPEEITSAEELTDDYYFNFPYILGKVLSMNTWEGLSEVNVTLKTKVDNDFHPTVMLNSQWNNPYVISESTNGFYTFFPHPIKDSGTETSTQSFDFLLIFDHPKIEAKEKFFSLELASEKKIFASFRKDFVHKVDDIYINI
ncbi:MAG: late competence development ComFB family protein, partial [Spirochaetota bacterium]|nr:late competence development ComFB family protein [Spirochaetota bacterium]